MKLVLIILALLTLNLNLMFPSQERARELLQAPHRELIAELIVQNLLPPEARLLLQPRRGIIQFSPAGQAPAAVPVIAR